MPFKNRLKVGGIPLWRRSMDFAIGAGLTAFIDTDDELIAQNALRLGYNVHRRRTPSEAEGGTHWMAIGEACRDLGLSSFVLLQPTSPFRSPAVLEDCLAAFDGSRPVLTCSCPGRWDGNIGIWHWPLVHLEPRWVANPAELSLQIDNPEDYARALLTTPQL